MTGKKVRITASGKVIETAMDRHEAAGFMRDMRALMASQYSPPQFIPCGEFAFKLLAREVAKIRRRGDLKTIKSNQDGPRRQAVGRRP